MTYLFSFMISFGEKWATHNLRFCGLIANFQLKIHPLTSFNYRGGELAASAYLCDKVMRTHYSNMHIL